ncbi:MAG TPA: hypothetical protein VFS31_14785, partial [Chitinophagaceae bacterium]|nr:hypothetical protein [Chitinophagaceae bacterium]
ATNQLLQIRGGDRATGGGTAHLNGRDINFASDNVCFDDHGHQTTEYKDSEGCVIDTHYGC